LAKQAADFSAALSDGLRRQARRRKKAAAKALSRHCVSSAPTAGMIAAQARGNAEGLRVSPMRGTRTVRLDIFGAVQAKRMAASENRLFEYRPDCRRKWPIMRIYEAI